MNLIVTLANYGDDLLLDKPFVCLIIIFGCKIQSIGISGDFSLK